MQRERWRKINGYKKYKVSDRGRVKSLQKKKPVILKQERHWKGYMKVDLCIDGVCKKQFVHRLVAIAFIENPEGKPIVNHKDRDKGHNRTENLEWMDESENVRHWLNDNAFGTPGPAGDIPF